MTDNQMQRARAIKQAYREKNKQDGHVAWTARDYMAGFVADIGELSELLMVDAGLRTGTGDTKENIRHEIGDCLWSIVALCDELGLSVEECFESSLSDVEARLDKGGQQS